MPFEMLRALLALVLALPGAPDREEALAVLRASAQAIEAARTFACHALREPGGAFVGQLPTSEGEVVIARLAEGGEVLAARLWAQGTNRIPGRAEPLAFVNAFDGQVLASLRAAEEILIEGDLAGGADSLLADGGIALLLGPLCDAAPFHSELAGEARLAGTSNVDGRACTVIEVELPAGSGYHAIRWHIADDDHLPRRSEMLYDIEGVKGSQITTVTGLQHGQPVDDQRFVLALPPGYERQAFVKASSLLPVGAAAPDWELLDARGVARSLHGLRGQIVLLDFWATWCGPCKAALPGIQSLHARFRDRGVTVLGVQCRDQGDASACLAKYGCDYPCLLAADDAATRYGVTSLPSFYIIDAAGAVAFRQEGHSPDLESRLAEVIETLLTSAPTPVDAR